jgi:hypothetical protein
VPRRCARYELFRHDRSGFPASLTVFNKVTDNITYIPKDTKDSYVESYFLSVQRQLAKNIVFDVAYVGNHGVKLQGFLNANQKDPQAGFARPFANWPSDITAAVNAFYSHYDSLQARYEQRFVAGLTLLNSFTWQHSLDNASASLEGNTPSPQDGNNISADYSQSDYNLPIANVTSLVYELPFGRGRTYLSNTNGLVDAVVGGWQVSGINTMQAGTPFNIGYSPSSANQVSQQITASYRGANLYRPDRVPDQPLIKKTKLPGTGYVQYINYAAFVSAANQGCCRKPAQPLRQRFAQPRPNSGFLPDRSCVEQKIQPAGRKHEAGIPHGVLQPLQPHQLLPAEQRPRWNARYYDLNLCPGSNSSSQFDHRWHAQQQRNRHQHLRATHHSVWSQADLLTVATDWNGSRETAPIFVSVPVH